METDLFFVGIILELLFYKILSLYFVDLVKDLVHLFQNNKKKNNFSPKITKIFKSIWAVLKPRSLPLDIQGWYLQCPCSGNSRYPVQTQWISDS